MRKIRSSMIFLLVIIALFTATAAFAEPAHQRRIRLAASLVQKMAEQEDAESLAGVIKSGKGVAIFPSVTKAGLIVGGQVGEGLVFLKKPDGSWTGPAFMGISGASYGLQIGVQSIGLVLVITNEKGLQAFTGGNSFKLGADLAVAAGPVGRRAEAGTDAKAKASIYSYSLAKGLFAGISLEGSVINQNRDANKAYWGRDLSAKAALKRPAKDRRVKKLIKEINALMRLAS